MTYDNEFLEGLVKSGTMILISEIGDKTFFIAAIMAMRHSRLTVRPVPPIPAEFTRLSLGLSADRPRFRSPVPIDSTGLHRRHRSARRDDRTIRGDGMGRTQPGESHSTFTPQRTFIHQSNDAIRKTSSSSTHTRASSHPPVNPSSPADIQGDHALPRRRPLLLLRPSLAVRVDLRVGRRRRRAGGD